MTNELNVVWWQNSLSIHQAPVIRSMSSFDGVSCTVISAASLSSLRLAMGWKVPDYGNAEVDVISDPSALLAVADTLGDADIHVFSGIGAYPSLDAVRHHIASKKQHGKIIAMTESWDPRGLKGAARRALLRMRVSPQEPKIDRVLTCGQLARQQLLRAGFPSWKLLPYGYFVDRIPITASPSASATPLLVFVGAFVECKAVDLLLSALTGLTHLDWDCLLIGSGPLEPRFRAIASRPALNGRVNFAGNLPNDQVQEILASGSLLILPSRYDGWGTVVNEALVNGTPCIVSSNAGSSDLIRSSLQGEVFLSGSRNGLENCIRNQLDHRVNGQDSRPLMCWCDAHISSIAVASYLKRIFSSDKVGEIDPPWKC